MADHYEHHSHCVFNLGYRIIFCPKCRQKIKTLWSPSYYVESIGHISEETVRRYIEERKETAQRKAGSISSHG